MHDRNGNALKKGDKVIIYATIVELNETEDFCNASLETEYGRRPDGNKERIRAINTGVLEKFDETPKVYTAPEAVTVE